MTHKPFVLSKNEQVIAVVPECCAGPGWANAPTWVYIENTVTHRLRTECIQPDERTVALHALFSVGAATHAALITAVPTKKIGAA